MNDRESLGIDRRALLGALAAAATASFAPPVAAADGDHDEMGGGPGPWFSAFGLRMRVEVSSASTGGAMSTTRVVSPPGGGPPAQVHTREDEVFVILRGHYRFWQKGMPTIDAPPGTLVRQHRGMVHQYRNVSASEGEHVLICLPGGLEGLFETVAKEGLVLPKDMGRVITLSAGYGLTYRAPIAD